MKILFFTFDIPFPLDSGGKIRAFHLIKGLSKNHEITLFTFFRQKEQLKKLENLREFCGRIKTFQRKTLTSPLNFLYLPFMPYRVANYYSPYLAMQLRKEVRLGDYDLVHFESFYTSMFLDEDILIPQVLGTENIEWKIYRDFASQQAIPLIKAAVAIEARRLKRFEGKTWKKADAILGVSKENCQEIKRISKKPCYLIPNGVDINKFKVSASKIKKGERILFVGNFSYIQNQDAVKYLVEEIFPLIQKNQKGAELLIAGRNPSKLILSYAGKKIKIRSDIDDIREAYAQADVLLAPIRAGSGTKFKILEAMASGLPVVTTGLGIEGLEAEDKKHVLTGNNPRQLAEAVLLVLDNIALRKKLVQNASKLAREKYGWERIIKDLEKAYVQIRGNF